MRFKYSVCVCVCVNSEQGKKITVFLYITSYGSYSIIYKDVRNEYNSIIIILFISHYVVYPH